MPYSDLSTNAAVNAQLQTVTKVQFFTAGYALQLAETPITFAAAAVTDGVSTAAVSSTPISDTWDATGTAAAVRLLTAANVVVFNGDGSWAVGTVGAVFILSTIDAVSGGDFQLTSCTHGQPVKVTGEP